MYQYVLIFCFLSVSHSFTPKKVPTEPKTFKLIQNIVRHNYERSLKRQHQLLVDRNYPHLGHHPNHTPFRQTRKLRQPRKTHRKINFQRKGNNQKNNNKVTYHIITEKQKWMTQNCRVSETILKLKMDFYSHIWVLI